MKMLHQYSAKTKRGLTSAVSAFGALRQNPKLLTASAFTMTNEKFCTVDLRNHTLLLEGQLFDDP